MEIICPTDEPDGRVFAMQDEPFDEDGAFADALDEAAYHAYADLTEAFHKDFSFDEDDAEDSE